MVKTKKSIVSSSKKQYKRFHYFLFISLQQLFFLVNTRLILSNIYFKILVGSISVRYHEKEFKSTNKNYVSIKFA